MKRLLGSAERSDSKPVKPAVLAASQVPDESRGWCAKCKAHTPGIMEYNSGTDSSRSKVCIHCKSGFMWNVPRDVLGSPMFCFKCSAVLGLLIAPCLIGADYYQPSDIDFVRFIVASVLAFFLVIMLGCTAWFTYWCSLWRSWVKGQGQQSPSKTD